MILATLTEAQQGLAELLRQAQHEAIGLTDERGNLVGVLAGVSEEDLDDLIVATPAFRRMIEQSRQSLAAEGSVSIVDLIEEARRETATRAAA